MKIPDRTTLRRAGWGSEFALRDSRELLRLARRLLIRREVAATGEDFGAFQVRTSDADFDFPPCAVLLRICRGVGEAVLCPDLRDHLVVRRVDVLHRRRKERLAAGGFGNLHEVRALLDAAARMFQE